MTDSFRVLVVDDDTDVLDLTESFLGQVRDDVVVETAVGGPAGLDVLATEGGRVDCVVSDYDMPELDGLEFLKAVRERHPNLPFILFTGKGSEEIASEAIAAGVTDYLQKKAGREQYEMLANRIVNAVERQRAERRATDLDRSNRVIRQVQQGLVAAETREEVEELVCAEFADADPYEFAWIGVPGEAGALEPRLTAGIATEHLQDAIAATAAVTRRKWPGAVAARTGEPQVVQDIQADAGFAPWRDHIGDAGLHSLGAVPLTYGDADYGVLLVYAGQPHAFDDEEMAVLAELGDTIGRAIDAAETSRALDFVNEVVEGVSAGIGAYDEHGDLVYANSAYADLLGYSVGELVDTPIWDVECTLTAENFETYWRSFDPGETRTVETEHVTADGTRIDVETTSTRVDIEGDTYHVGTITDITERVANRHRLETYARRFEAVFDDPAAFIGLLEPDGTVMQVNDNALSFIGAKQRDVAGKPFWETPWWSFSSDVQTELQTHIEAAAAGEFVRFEVENRGDGNTSVTLDTILRPVRDAEGEVVTLLAEGRNITERKHLERELRRSKTALQELYSASAQPGSTFEERLTSVLRTGTRHLDTVAGGYIEPEPDGESLRIVETWGDTDLTGGQVVPMPDDYREYVIDGPQTISVPDSRKLDWNPGFMAYIGGLVTVEGDLAGHLWFGDDELRPGGFSEFDETFVELLGRWLSVELEQRATNDRLATQNDRLERFAAIVTHDLRNPLTTAEGWLQLVAEDHPDDDRIDRIASALARMDELIKDIRDMTWSGQEVTSPDEISLAAVADAAWSTCRHEDATLTIQDDVGHILADESRTRQILENLFRNSVEHGSTANRDASRLDDTVEHGSTNPRSHAHEDSVEHSSPDVSIEVGQTPDGFYVADDGPGIPPADRDLVFDHGFTTTADGTGFGLNIVAEAVAAHGWEITVTESETGGARFEIEGVDRTPVEVAD